jgi:hypothetical protein
LAATESVIDSPVLVRVAALLLIVVLIIGDTVEPELSGPQLEVTTNLRN